MISENTYTALKIIQPPPTVDAAGFALFMWPGSRMHNKIVNTGNGACRGKGAWLAAGSYLGRLQREKLVRKYPPATDNCVEITEAGVKAILEYEEAGKHLSEGFAESILTGDLAYLQQSLQIHTEQLNIAEAEYNKEGGYYYKANTHKEFIESRKKAIAFINLHIKKKEKWNQK